jgi:hypothetical protein
VRATVILTLGLTLKWRCGDAETEGVKRGDG